jgi:hypothetical protein
MDAIDAKISIFTGGNKHDGSAVERVTGQFDFETIGLNTHTAREIRRRRHSSRGAIIREVLADVLGK